MPRSSRLISTTWMPSNGTSVFQSKQVLWHVVYLFHAGSAFASTMAFFKWRSSCDVILFKSSHDSMTRDSKANVHRSHFWARSPMEHRILPTGSLIMISICFQKANKMVKAIHNIAVPNVNHDFISDCQKFYHDARIHDLISSLCTPRNAFKDIWNEYMSNKLAFDEN